MALGRAKPHARFVMCGGTSIQSLVENGVDGRKQVSANTTPQSHRVPRYVAPCFVNRHGVLTGAQNYLMIVSMRIRYGPPRSRICASELKLPRMEGFIVFDYAKEYPRALQDLAQWLSEGKIKRKETVVKGGLDQAQNALRDLYNGVNTGEYPSFETECELCR